MPQIALAIALAGTLWPIPALGIGFGIEGGGSYTKTSGLGYLNDIWTPTGGIIVEDEFPISVLCLDLWADVQTPTQLQTAYQTSGTGNFTPVLKYIPIDLGLRLGLNIGLLQPYIGVLGQVGFLTDSDGSEDINSPLWGLGGDLGLDLAVAMLRLGIELRGVETLTAIATDPAVSYGSAIEFEALASVRVSF